MSKMLRFDLGRVALDKVLTKFIHDLGSSCLAYDGFDCNPQIILEFPESKGMTQKPYHRGGPDMFISVLISAEADERLKTFIETYFGAPTEITEIEEKAISRPDTNEWRRESTLPIDRFPFLDDHERDF